MNFAKPTIVKSPFGENLAIAYPYTTDGKWMHKDEIKKYYLRKEDIIELIRESPWEGVNGKAYIEINILEQRLGLIGEKNGKSNKKTNSTKNGK